MEIINVMNIKVIKNKIITDFMKKYVAEMKNKKIILAKINHVRILNKLLLLYKLFKTLGDRFLNWCKLKEDKSLLS